MNDLLRKSLVKVLCLMAAVLLVALGVLWQQLLQVDTPAELPHCDLPPMPALVPWQQPNLHQPPLPKVSRSPFTVAFEAPPMPPQARIAPPPAKPPVPQVTIAFYFQGIFQSLSGKTYAFLRFADTPKDARPVAVTAGSALPGGAMVVEVHPQQLQIKLPDGAIRTLDWRSEMKYQIPAAP